MNCVFVFVAVVATLATVNAVGKCNIGSIQKKIKPVVDAERLIPYGCEVDKEGMFNFLKPTKVTDDHVENLKWRAQCKQFICKIDAVKVEECEFDSQGNRYNRDVMDKFEEKLGFRSSCPSYKKADERRAKEKKEQEKRDGKTEGSKEDTTVNGKNSSSSYSSLSSLAAVSIAAVLVVLA